MLFGDEQHVASRWYGVSEGEREKIAHEAFAVMPKNGENADVHAKKADAVRTEHMRD